MAAADFNYLMNLAKSGSVEPEPKPRTVPPGSYRTQVVMAKHGYSRNGRDKYKVSLIVVDGEYAGRCIAWHLTIVQEHPNLLHEFFCSMAKIGVGQMEFASATCHDDIVRKIILTGAYLDVIVQQGRGEFLDVVHARRVIVP